MTRIINGEYPSGHHPRGTVVSAPVVWRRSGTSSAVAGFIRRASRDIADGLTLVDAQARNCTDPMKFRCSAGGTFHDTLGRKHGVGDLPRGHRPGSLPQHVQAANGRAYVARRRRLRRRKGDYPPFPP